VAWSDEIIPDLRARLGDDGATLRFTDAQLRVLWLSAGRQVISDCYGVDFVNTYVISLLSATITPDPTVAGTVDPDYMTLTTLKAACIANQGAATKGAGQAIAIGSSGGDRIDLRDTAKARTALLKTGACQEYIDAKTRFLLENQGQNRLGIGVSTAVRAY